LQYGAMLSMTHKNYSSWIKRVVALYDYQKSERTKEEFNEVGIELIIDNNQIKQYDNE